MHAAPPSNEPQARVNARRLVRSTMAEKMTCHWPDAPFVRRFRFRDSRPPRHEHHRRCRICRLCRHCDRERGVRGAAADRGAAQTRRCQQRIALGLENLQSAKNSGHDGYLLRSVNPQQLEVGNPKPTSNGSVNRNGSAYLPGLIGRSRDSPSVRRMATSLLPELQWDCGDD